jgi:adenosylhomocysteine nucleosidase
VTQRGAPLPGANARPATPGPTATTYAAIVGVVVALPAEAQTLVGVRLPFGEAFVVNPHLRVCLGGIGINAAEASCRTLLAAGATALVSWGVAGGLDPTLHSGTLVITSRLIDVGGASLATTTADRAASAWSDRFAAHLINDMAVSRGAIAAVDHVLQTVAAKRALGATGAAAADMETGIVARVARAVGVPSIAVRAIADTASTALPAGVISAVDDRGRVRVGRFASALARHPEEILLLPALARGYRAALRALRVAAQRTGPALDGPGVMERERGAGASADRPV